MLKHNLLLLQSASGANTVVGNQAGGKDLRFALLVTSDILIRPRDEGFKQFSSYSDHGEGPKRLLLQVACRKGLLWGRLMHMASG